MRARRMRTGNVGTDKRGLAVLIVLLIAARALASGGGGADAAPAQRSISFGPRTVIDSTDRIFTSVRAADVNGDGAPDAVTASAFTNSAFSWYQNNGAAMFSENLLGPSGFFTQVAASDVDGDGDMDLLRTDPRLAFAENVGGTTFVGHAVGSAPTPIAVAVSDVDGDMDTDIVCAASDRIAWYENDGSENFTERVIAASVSPPPPPATMGIAARDLDRDGDIDIVVGGGWTGALVWYENDGNETFTVNLISTVPTGAVSLHVVDIEGDGDWDVLTTAESTETIDLYENDGTQTFTRNIYGRCGAEASVTAADLEADGDMDVLVASDLGVVVYESEGFPTYVQHTVDAPFFQRSAVFADLNLDGKLDILAGAGNELVWYMQIGNLDFGDLPTAYALTTLANDGARHTIPEFGAITLGTAIDAEPDGQPSSDAGSSGANGDDGTGIDDEDGVSAIGTWIPGAGGGAIQVTVQGGSGLLSGWIDWNGDADFRDAGEQVLNLEAVSPGTQLLTFDVPAGAISANQTYSWFSRFRLAPTGTTAIAVTGEIDGGEVEDHYLRVGGTIPRLISADITNSTTWTAGETIVVTQPVFVRNGAALTIQAGTVVRFSPSNGGLPGALIVARGSRIYAMGTAQAPIVLTDLHDDNIGASTGSGLYGLPNNGLTGRWGGLAVLGSAPITGGGEAHLPGLGPVGTYTLFGGTNENDNSGELHYVSIRYSGYVVDAGQEINGLTMAGVGRRTRVDHVEVFQDADDGFQWYGGVVNAAYLLAWSCGDDAFDMEDGYSGKGQFWLGVNGVMQPAGLMTDAGIEFHGDANNPLTKPTLFNVTCIGHGNVLGDPILETESLAFKGAAAGRFFSGLCMDVKGACARITGSTTNAVYESADNTLLDASTLPLPGTALEVAHSTFWRFLNPAAPFTGGGSYPLFASPTLMNRYFEALDPAPIAELTRSSDLVSIGSHAFRPIVRLNPAADTATYGSTVMTGGRVPPDDGFFTPVAFCGAFAGTRNWAAPWSMPSRLGIMLAQESGDYTGVVPTVRANGQVGPGPITVSQSGMLSVSLQLATDMHAGAEADFWVVARTATAWYHYDVATGTWQPDLAVTHQGPLFNFGPFPVLNVSGLPVGTYAFYLGVDLNRDALVDFDKLFVDGVLVEVVP